MDCVGRGGSIINKAMTVLHRHTSLSQIKFTFKYRGLILFWFFCVAAKVLFECVFSVACIMYLSDLNHYDHVFQKKIIYIVYAYSHS